MMPAPARAVAVQTRAVGAPARARGWARGRDLNNGASARTNARCVRAARATSAKASKGGGTRGKSEVKRVRGRQYARETPGNTGWSVLEVWENLGVVWDFVAPSSAEGRVVVKEAYAASGNKLRGISGWRKAMWEEAAAKAPITFVSSHTPLPEKSKYRVCWCPASNMPNGQKRDVVMFYLSTTRKFYFLNDIAKGALMNVDQASCQTPEAIYEASQKIYLVNEIYRDVYNRSINDAAVQDATWNPFVDELMRVTGVLKDKADQKAAGALADAAQEAHFESPIDGWNAGVGATPESLYIRLGVNFNFHGPAGVVSRAIITAVGEQRGMDLSGAETWAKHKWVDAAEELSITAESTHASITAVGRGWKVCWIDGNEDMKVPAVLVWSPEEGKYFSFGAIKRKGNAAGVSTEDIIQAVLGVARSRPTPPGLKEALLRDNEFLQVTGRLPSSTSTTPTKITMSEVEASFDDSEEGTVYVEVDEDDEDESGDEDDDEVDLNIDNMFFNNAAEPSAWRNTIQEEDMYDPGKVGTDPMYYPPGFQTDEERAADLLPPLGDFPQDGPTSPGEFYSRSAGYLSFVENDFDDDDLKRELGIDRDDMYRGPKDFPDVSKNPTPTPAREMVVNLRESSPKGLPKANVEDAYHTFELHGVDFIISRTNDGRLDLREVYSARRDSYGRFVEEAQRVNTSAFMSFPPAYYHEIAWTELRVTNQEDFDSDAPVPSFNTTEETTTKIYLVYARNEASAHTAYDRQLDFSKPVVMMSAEDVGMSIVHVRGATDDPNASLIIKNGELYCQDEMALETYENIIRAHEAALEADKPDVSKEFLIETDTEVEARAMEEEEDTPDVDNL
uniref:Uncharacterized protein n=1 Tax=Ostreococcus mediterraneus TaxID=1486918 RepID=A0A7S0KGD0_9CHLO|mmetsp:Transcript_4232/g.15502  ORF Transcript_4232/g.15502 Transcript_4232/m.15502 type:complete len:847 (+) Transcript_4232:51-2591(+)